MAVHNSVILLGLVRAKPEIVEGLFNPTAAVPVTVVLSERNEGGWMAEGQERYATPLVISSEEAQIEEIKTWKPNDIVQVKGFLATREIDKSAVCPECGTRNRRIEACAENGVKSGGNRVYVYPIFCEKVRSFETQEDAHVYLIEHQEISNMVTMVGHLTKDPISISSREDRALVRYQIACNRKYCAKGMDEISERTDYPWIYSYGDQAKTDMELLQKGSCVLVDGALQTRKYLEPYTCRKCGYVYNVKGKTLEVLSYSTEYF